MEERMGDEAVGMLSALIGTISGAMGFFLITGIVILCIGMFIYLYSKDEAEPPHGDLEQHPQT